MFFLGRFVVVAGFGLEAVSGKASRMGFVPRPASSRMYCCMYDDESCISVWFLAGQGRARQQALWRKRAYRALVACGGFAGFVTAKCATAVRSCMILDLDLVVGWMHGRTMPLRCLCGSSGG